MLNSAFADYSFPEYLPLSVLLLMCLSYKQES